MMPEDSSLPLKDILLPAKSPLMWKLAFLVFGMVCGVFICFIWMKQLSFGNPMSFINVHVSDNPCPKPNIEEWEIPYVHFPKPVTFSREECACNPVRYFVLLSTQRSGSGWFETFLNSHMNVSCNGEILAVKVRRENASSIVKNLDKVYNLDWFTSASKNECTAAVGFKWMLNQGMMQYHEEILNYFTTNGVSIIFLFRRNLLRRMISILANKYDHDFKLLNGTHKSHVHTPREAEILASYKPSLNASTLIHELKQWQKRAAKALLYFNSTRHMVLYYEDVVKNHTKLLDVQDFIGVPRMNLTSRQVKIHKRPLSEQVANWDDVLRTLNGTEFESFLEADYSL